MSIQSFLTVYGFLPRFINILCLHFLYIYYNNGIFPFLSFPPSPNACFSNGFLRCSVCPLRHYSFKEGRMMLCDDYHFGVLDGRHRLDMLRSLFQSSGVAWQPTASQIGVSCITREEKKLVSACETIILSPKKTPAAPCSAATTDSLTSPDVLSTMLLHSSCKKTCSSYRLEHPALPGTCSHPSSFKTSASPPPVAKPASNSPPSNRTSDLLLLLSRVGEVATDLTWVLSISTTLSFFVK